MRFDLTGVFLLFEKVDLKVDVAKRTAYLYRLRWHRAAAFIEVSLGGKALISSQVAISSKQTSVISTYALLLNQRAAKGAPASHLRAVKAHSHGA